MNENILPKTCPSCENELSVKKLVCIKCNTEIDGCYQLPLLASLPKSYQDFILEFTKSGGSLKDMAKLMGLSYPTVRNQLNDIIEAIKKKERSKK